jgi:hypothetical protein
VASVDGKSEKVAGLFGAYFLCKAAHPLELHSDRGEAERLPTPGPLLSHSMTGGLGPASQRNGRWRQGKKMESKPPEPRDGIKQESEPPDARGAGGGRAPRGSRQGGKDIPALSRREQAVHPAQRWDMAPPAVSFLTRGGPGGLCRYIRIGYLLLGCPDP